jgi:hypothetical protein
MVSGINIKVDKEKLLATLETNRAAHGAAYETAKRGYIRVTTQQLQEHIERLANGDLIERAWIPSPPDDHTSDYDDVISMMEWSMDNEVELTQAQFKQYVQDDWGWKDAWVTSNTAYIESAR